MKTEKEPPNIGRFRMHFGKHFTSPSPNAFGNHVKAIEEFFGGGKKIIKSPYFMEKNCLNSSRFIKYIPRDCQNKKDSKLFFWLIPLVDVMMSPPPTQLKF